MPSIALVGAGPRLGLSLARVFGAHGYQVALIARSERGLADLAQRLSTENVEAVGYPADVTDPAALTSALDLAAAQFGPIKVLQYSAPYVPVGDTYLTGVLDVTVENLRPQIEASCYGAITAARAVLPAMSARGVGTMLFTTGASAVAPVPWAGSVGAAGAAVHNWAVNLNAALGDRGIYVGHVAIGVWITGTPGMPDDVTPMPPDEIANRHWDLHAARGPAEQLITC